MSFVYLIGENGNEGSYKIGSTAITPHEISEHVSCNAFSKTKKMVFGHRSEDILKISLCIVLTSLNKEESRCSVRFSLVSMTGCAGINPLIWSEQQSCTAKLYIIELFMK